MNQDVGSTTQTRARGAVFSVRYASPPPQSNHAPLKRVVSGGHGSMMSVLSVSKLEGFKINKRGDILDEEGEAIGELCEGDIRDCVRRRVHANGEVLDNYGSIVGRVRLLGRAQDSPITRLSSPIPFYQQQQQQQCFQEQPMSPACSVARRESAAEAFTPAWQQQHLHNPQPFIAQELQQYLAMAPQDSPRSVVRPIDFPNNATAVELPAIEAEQRPEEEILPIFDHSDVFLPVPTIPLKSPRRAETPSPVIEEAHPRPVSEQPAQAHLQKGQEMPMAQSKHTSALVHAHQQYNPEPQSQGWAAAAAIEVVQEEPEQNAELPPHVQQQRRQALARSSSNDTMTELAKSYSRPTMSSVPEDSQVATVDRSPALFSYQGGILVSDGLMPNAMLALPRALGAKSPTHPDLPRQNSANLQGINAMQFSAGGGIASRSPPPKRQFTTGVPAPRPIATTMHSSNAPLKRSPLSSQGKKLRHPMSTNLDTNTLPTEATPPDSDEGSIDGDGIGLAHGMRSRQPSVHTMASMQSYGRQTAHVLHARRQGHSRG
ncbi:hypothetical protein LTR36_001920 [Oleoguttula mirabilis]|uniref:Uncharacterized protein n=1 Tax=Oleoguttula mirabilis TaxID=1507867 RepID=A0AAV9JMX1_9PEZI|nr:hypothetical protein LTR36_001920 [Oleoguttula mirabilis]